VNESVFFLLFGIDIVSRVIVRDLERVCVREREPRECQIHSGLLDTHSHVLKTVIYTLQRDVHSDRHAGARCTQ
jgi:hypothetical protein